MGDVAFQSFAGDVVAAQCGLGAGMAEQPLNIPQRDALVQPDGADRSAQRVWADGPGDSRSLGGSGDVAVHASAVHAGTTAGAQRRPRGAVADGGFDGGEGGDRHWYAGGLVAVRAAPCRGGKTTVGLDNR